jgi:hypothetical protein
MSGDSLTLFSNTKFIELDSKNRQVAVKAIFEQTNGLLYAIRDAKLSII